MSFSRERTLQPGRLAPGDTTVMVAASSLTCAPTISKLLFSGSLLFRGCDFTRLISCWTCSALKQAFTVVVDVTSRDFVVDVTSRDFVVLSQEHNHLEVSHICTCCLVRQQGKEFCF